MTSRRRPTQSGSFKKETQNRPLQQRRAELVKGGALSYLPTMEEIIGWTYNALLTGVSFRYADGVWTAVIKAVKDGHPIVSYVNVGKFGRCVEVAIDLASKGLLVWYPDQHPVKTWKRKRWSVQ